MKKYTNFMQYMEDMYYDDIFSKVRNYIVSKHNDFENNEIYKVTWVELDTIYIKGVTFKESEDGLVEIRVTVEASIAVSGQTRYGMDTIAATKLYNVFILARLEEGLHDIKFSNVTDYYENKYERDKSLSQNLVPYMYEEDVEKHAEDFLRKHYPKALLQPMPVPVEEIALSMGMKIFYAPLEDNVFGKTYFADEKVTVYDSILAKETKEIVTEPGTMLINPSVFFMNNVGTANNTIMHECVHWDRHRRPFELQRLLQIDCNHISCEVVEFYDGIPQEASALRWMEWQANQLTPRILMPAAMTKKVYDKELRDTYTLNPHKRFAEIMEIAVAHVSLFFQVSKFAAKLRLIELGYDNVQGAFVFCDGRYLPPFAFSKGAIKPNQTFIVDEKNAMFVIFMNPILQEMFFAGKIIYANSMVCLNTEKYIEYNEHGFPILTEYALEHVDECCFVFDRTISVSQQYSDTFYRRCFLCRDVSADTFIEAQYDPVYENNQKVSERGAAMKQVAAMSKEIAEVMSELPGGFKETLRYHMRRKDVNEEELSGRSNLSVQTISKYLNDSEANKKFENVLAVCIGMNLHPVFMEDLLAKSGYTVQQNMKHYLIKFLIWNHSDENVDEWQKKLDEWKTGIQLPKRN